MTLLKIFNSPPGSIIGEWLFLPGDCTGWAFDTEGYFLEHDDETGEPIIDAHLKTLDLRVSLDVQTIESVVAWADRLSGTPDDNVRLESFIYYYRFDAFLPRIGAPDPPPMEETLRGLDLEFYDGLGAERGEKPCSEPGCCRGSVRFSVLCRIHHFENVKAKKCPFDH